MAAFSDSNSLSEGRHANPYRAKIRVILDAAKLRPTKNSRSNSFGPVRLRTRFFLSPVTIYLTPFYVNVRYESEVEQFGRIDIHRSNLTNPDSYRAAVHEFQVYIRTLHPLRSNRVLANNQFNNPYFIINTIKLCVTNPHGRNAPCHLLTFGFQPSLRKIAHLLT
jgi:hypothetical protein